MSNNLEVIVRRAVGEKLSSADIQKLIHCIQSGNAILAPGERSISLGGDASDAIVVTGNGNTINIGSANSTAIKEFLKPILTQPTGANECSSQAASKDSDALSELMSAPAVRMVVTPFYIHFQQARKQIKVLGNYKDLHDQLHELEFKCYRTIEQQAEKLPDEETGWDELWHYMQQLEGIVNKVQVVAKRETFVTSEIEWIEELAQALEAFQVALKESDIKQLQKAIELIKGVLKFNPVIINTSLKNAARALDLPSLANAMNSIREKLARVDFAPEKTNQFHNDVEELIKLSTRLDPLVEEHDAWQRIDMELRYLAAELKKDTSYLEIIWTNLKARTERLYSKSKDSWASSLKKECEELDVAIAAKNPSKIRTYFHRYRTKANLRFFNVDFNIKSLCDELRDVDERLLYALRVN